MKHLEELGLLPVLQEEVLQKKKPLLGICLGMQALFEDSYEGTYTKGLGFTRQYRKNARFECKDSTYRLESVRTNAKGFRFR